MDKDLFNAMIYKRDALCVMAADLIAKGNHSAAMEKLSEAHDLSTEIIKRLIGSPDDYPGRVEQ